MRQRSPILLLAAAAACADSSERVARVDTTRSEPAAADTSAWTVDDNAVGPLNVGMTVAAAGRALGSTLQLAYEATEGCDMIAVPGGPTGLSLMFVDDTLVRFDITASVLLTRAGVGVGSSDTAVVAAYGPRVLIRPHKYADPPAHYLIVVSPSDSSYAMVFESDGERVTRYRAGRRPEVEWVEGCL